MNLFSERKKLEEDYYDWISKNNVRDCLFNVISFLESIGRLKDKHDMEEDKWIPCEVEQPKEYGEYLYTDKNDEVHEGCYSPPKIGMVSGWSTCEADGYRRLQDEDVIAWQPLPQPYKREGAENEK